MGCCIWLARENGWFASKGRFVDWEGRRKEKMAAADLDVSAFGGPAPTLQCHYCHQGTKRDPRIRGDLGFGHATGSSCARIGTLLVRNERLSWRVRLGGTWSHGRRLVMKYCGTRLRSPICW